MLEYQPSLSVEQLVTRVMAAFESLDLKECSDLQTLVRVVSAKVGRGIEVYPTGDSDWENVTGLMIPRPTRYDILIRATDPAWYQGLSLAHELSHVLLAHPGCSLPFTAPAAVRHSDGAVGARARPVLAARPDEEIDFFDGEAVMEEEAERLAHLLAQAVAAPRFSDDEAVFG